jgi:hypothetical protein
MQSITKDALDKKAPGFEGKWMIKLWIQQIFAFPPDHTSPCHFLDWNCSKECQVDLFCTRICGSKLSLEPFSFMTWIELGAPQSVSSPDLKQRD